ATDDFFRSRIDHMIDLRHPLAVLASRMPWQEIEARVAQVFSRKGRAGALMPDLDLFGEQVQRAAVSSNAGRPRVPLRIMIALLYLKHAFNESDEGVVERWGETPTWQFFSGQAYFEHHRPCDATTLIKFRQLLGEEGVEELLAQTINVAVDLQLIKPQELTRVIVDSTVQHKAIAHPTDSRLLEVARAKLVEAAKDVGIDLKQTFAKEGKELTRKAARYAHARQFKRMKRAIKRQRTIVGRLQREVDRKASAIGSAVRQALGEILNKARRIVDQSGQRKAVNGQRKLYSFHAPEVECISKGKARTPYEFGVKVGIASTLNGNLIVGARAFHGNPYDGHTLHEQLEQATILEQERKLLKRRQAIEPIIGHLKADHRMDRCHLKGERGERLHAVLCAAGYNIRWLLRMIIKKGVAFLPFVLLCLHQASGLGRSWVASVMAPGLGTAQTWLSAHHASNLHGRPGAHASVSA
ncbi:MAG: IS5 family transposase, partial [Stenotrophomonas sp.]|uniref:IS5 family transposase n=1 Tax=Stenotrophomonas sp. TaxID=69392 RepID=UPI00198E1A87